MEHQSDTTELPAALRVFLHSCIESISQVELLLMMRGSERMRTARDTADEWRVYVFLFRLLAFVLILYGVAEKNRRSEGR